MHHDCGFHFSQALLKSTLLPFMKMSFFSPSFSASRVEIPLRLFTQYQQTTLKCRGCEWGLWLSLGLMLSFKQGESVHSMGRKWGVTARGGGEVTQLGSDQTWARSQEQSKNEQGQPLSHLKSPCSAVRTGGTGWPGGSAACDLTALMLIRSWIQWQHLWRQCKPLETAGELTFLILMSGLLINT